MDSSTKNSVTASSPAKTLIPQLKPKILESHKDENQNPNLKSPSLKLSKSPSIKSYTKTPKSTLKNPNPNPANSSKERVRERKFVVAKRISKQEKAVNLKFECNCKDKIGNKCLCVAYKTLRASQEEFFKPQINGLEINENNPDEVSEFGGMGGENNKRGRDIVPETGSGKVMSLIKAFERLKTETPELKDVETFEGDEKKGVKLEVRIKAPETQMSSSSICPSDFSVSSSLDCSQGSFTFSSKGTCAGRRSQRNSTELCRILGERRLRRKQQLKATLQQPFKLLTEQRGRTKEEEFSKKLQEMMVEEQKQRIPIAQGLPWTTDEPENLVKPPVKEITIPVDLVLHSDVRAEDRAEFDRQLTEKEALIEQFKMERERQQKLAEEEEIRRLRKELIPKAQPMPYFDRPFIPRRKPPC